MFRSWKFGTAFGIGIYVHWSFLLLAAYVLFTNGTQGGWALALFSVLFLFAVFGCVVLHELGHALMARAFGIGTRDITLYPIGGIARLERMGDKPGEELCIALAGPAVNFVLAVILFALGIVLVGARNWAGFLNTPDELAGLWGVGFLFNLLAANVVLGVGMVLALLLAIAALFVNLMLLVLAAFVFFAGRQELAALRRRYAEPVEALPADAEVIDVDPIEPRPTFSGVLWDRHLGMWVVWRDGRPVGMFSAYSE
jgi:Zn-dependent protease